jgi:hypothetical protein
MAPSQTDCFDGAAGINRTISRVARRCRLDRSPSAPADVDLLFVFGIVLRPGSAPNPSREGFVLYFLAGMLPWLFSDAVGRAPSVIVDNRNLSRSSYFVTFCR